MELKKKKKFRIEDNWIKLKWIQLKKDPRRCWCYGAVDCRDGGRRETLQTRQQHHRRPVQEFRNYFFNVFFYYSFWDYVIFYVWRFLYPINYGYFWHFFCPVQMEIDWK